MKLPPPIEQYTKGDKPSHTIRPRLHEHINFLKEDETTATLTKAGYLTDDGKVSKQAQVDGLVDTCDGKVLWNLKKTKKALLTLTAKKTAPAKSAPKPINIGGTIPPPSPQQQQTVWTDLESIGTYFGVGKVKIGKWVDELGLRAFPKKERNESGDFDMMDFAADAKEKASLGFNTKKPTEKALELGYAQVTMVEKGNKTFEIVKWNKDKVKAALVKAGHELDLEKKMIHKGKGKNGDVQVESMDDRAQKLYSEWKKLYNNPKTRAESWKLFDKTAKPILMRVEQLMGRPRFLIDKKYKRNPNPF